MIPSWSIHLHSSTLAFTTVHIVMFAMFVAILSIVMIYTRNRTARSMQVPRHMARERYAASNTSRTTLREMDEVMLELDKLAREVNGRLDIRFAKLEALIRDADERIAKFDRLTRDPESARRLDVTLGEEQPDAQEPPPKMEDSPHAEVYRLADAGMTDLQIAEETGKTTGEIELIRTLRKAQGVQSQTPAASGSVDATG